MADPPPSSRDRLALTTQNWRTPYDTRLVSLLSCSPEAEHFRCLRHSLLHTLARGRSTVIGVSSADHGDGKTTTAINLAAALEESGRFSVLLVDADLRTAAIADRLELGAVTDDGLDAALADWSISLGDVVRRFPRPCRLDVLPAGARPDVAGLLVASPRFGMLLREARAQYDFVVVDTPPLVPAADCRTIAPWIDGFVVVVAAHKTPRRSLEEGLNAMRRDKILGLVFSGDDGSPGVPFGKFRVAS